MSSNHKRLWCIILILFFAGLYFALRIPLTSESLYFEEGIFAELMVHRPCGPNYNLNARMDGVNIYGAISHPAFSYELIRLGGWMGRSFLADPVYLDDAVVTPRLRILSSAYQFFIWAVILFVLLFSRVLQNKWKYVILFMAAFSPLALKTSVLLQIDNTAGAVLCGTAAILIFLAAALDCSNGWRLGYLFVSGCFAGLGKQEWAMALLPALLILFFVQWVKKSNTEMLYIGVIFAGLVSGTGISYLYDPINFMAAFRYMALFSGLSKSSTEPWQLERWWKLIQFEAPVIYVCFVLQAIFILSVIVNRKQSLLKYVLFLYGTVLFFSYLMINWNYEFRYYVPSLVVLTLACIAVLPSSPPGWYNRSVALLAATVILSTIPFLLFYKLDKNTELERIQSGVLKSTENTILFINSGAGWNKTHIDYINNTNDYKSAQKFAEKNGKILLLP
jgi:hypothetical protein